MVGASGAPGASEGAMGDGDGAVTGVLVIFAAVAVVTGGVADTGCSSANPPSKPGTMMMLDVSRTTVVGSL